MNILLDVDGVLANFVQGSIDRHCRPEHHDQITQWNYYEDWGLDARGFWAELQGFDFWANLTPYPWMSYLWERLGRLGEVTISTSPSLDPECPAGKLAWLARHLDIQSNEVMIGARKHLMAGPDTILIDDIDSNIARFREAGGCGILFPQPWNAGPASSTPALAVVQEVKQIVFST